MALLPEGFALPPLPYLLALVAGLAAVGWALSRRRPAVTDRLVLAAVPWMVTGSAAHVLYVLGALPATVRPLAGTPAVYLTVAAVAGATWVVTDATERKSGDADGATTDRARPVAAVGLLACLPLVAAVLAAGARRGSLRLGVAALILVVAGAAAAATWGVLTRLRPDAAVTGGVGALVVTGHALDGVSTAVGVDLLGFGERTPLSRSLIEFGASLPTANAIGSAWPFVLVKLVVAAVVVAALADLVREDPAEGRLLLGFVAAVGLGPGVHNLLLFAVS
ncbi:MAG: DUF63 family protein [Haloplanus sp.]